MSDSNDVASTAMAEFTAPMDLAKASTLFQIEESLMLLALSAGLNNGEERGFPAVYTGIHRVPEEFVRVYLRIISRRIAIPSLPAAAKTVVNTDRQVPLPGGVPSDSRPAPPLPYRQPSRFEKFRFADFDRLEAGRPDELTEKEEVPSLGERHR